MLLQIACSDHLLDEGPLALRNQEEHILDLQAEPTQRLTIRSTDDSLKRGSSRDIPRFPNLSNA
jgi:hypothetical protein